MRDSKFIKFQQSQALTSHFESFWSIVWHQKMWHVRNKFRQIVEAWIRAHLIDFLMGHLESASFLPLFRQMAAISDFLIDFWLVNSEIYIELKRGWILLFHKLTHLWVISLLYLHFHVFCCWFVIICISALCSEMLRMKKKFHIEFFFISSLDFFL